MARVVNGAALRAIRELAGVDQPDLAKRVGIHQASLSNIERGQRGASPEVVRKLADHLGVTVDAITSVAPEPVRVAP